MNKFKPGDRVRYYGAFNELSEVSMATVREVRDDGMLYLALEEPAEVVDGVACSWAHPKQVRRLVKRERRRVWILIERKERKGLALPVIAVDRPPVEYESFYREFVEVRRRK